MNQLKNYIWLIDTIRRYGKISYKELAELWESNKDISDYKPLHRGTFNRWREAIHHKLGIEIRCQSAGGYKYYIANPEDIDTDDLKRWIIDTFTVGNIVEDNISLKNRILVEEIPSGRILASIVEAMKRNRLIEFTYHSFKTDIELNCKIEPYCVRLFEGRWYLLGKRVSSHQLMIYGLDQIESLAILEDTFKFPKNFSASKYFESMYGIVDQGVKPQRIVVRAYKQHRHYIKSLPIHHSQRLIDEGKDYADFELFLSPTYDFIMRLLHDGAWLEVIYPESLRRGMKGWIADMYDCYGDID